MMVFSCVFVYDESEFCLNVEFGLKFMDWANLKLQMNFRRYSLSKL